MIAIGVRVIPILLISPITDGYYFTTESISCVLSLENPYNHTFSAIPSSLLTKGSESIFAYLPFVTIFSTPFYLIGDIRYGFTLSDILIGFAIYRINLKSHSHKAILLSSIYLFFPFTIGWTVWAGVNTNIGVAFLMLSVMFMQDHRGLEAGTCFGLSLAALQLSWIVMPFLFYYFFKNGLKRFFLYSIAVCGMIMIPFFAAGINDMVYDVLLFHLTRQTAPVFIMNSFPHAEINVSINGFLHTFLGFEIPLYVKAFILLPTIFILLRKSTDFRKTVFNALIFSIIFLFILPNNLLINYLVLPLSLLLIVSHCNRGKRYDLQSKNSK